MRAAQRRTRPAAWRHALSWTASTALPGGASQNARGVAPFRRKIAENVRPIPSNPNLDVASMMEYQC